MTTSTATVSTATVPAVGTTMPDVDLVGPDGATTTLHRARSGGPAVVYFLRAAGCPVCVRHARSLVELAGQGRLADGVRVLLVAPGGPAEAAELARRVGAVGGGADVGVWASGEGHASAGLGSFLSLQHSGTFAVGADGDVRYRRTATLPPQSFSRGELLEVLGR